MRNGDRIYQYEIWRLCGMGHEHPMPVTPLEAQTLYIYGVRGGADWETAERYLVDHHTLAEWAPGRYKIAVTVRTNTGTHPVATVERLLPLHPEYAKLPYSRGQGDLPARAYVHTLISRYPDSTLEQIAEHLTDFDAHYRAQISTPELTTRTGYQPPPDWVRPLSPYADDPTEATQ